MMKKLLASLTALLVLGTNLAQAAYEPTFRPAQLTDRPSSLQNMIKYPKILLRKKIYESVVIRCDAAVSVTGAITHNFCPEGSPTETPYIRAINRAAKAAVLQPAKVNDVTKKVFLQYYIVFKNSDKGHSIDVIPNSGLQMDQFGAEYTSAQRYKNGSGNFGTGCSANPKITIKAIIDKKGLAKTIAVEPEDTNNHCKKYLIKAFKEQRFIPAFYKGQTMDSYYSEAIFNNLREE